MDKAVTYLPKIEKDDRIFELQNFTDSKLGFSFYTVEFKTLEAAIANIEKNSPGQGAKLALALLNRAMAFALRNKAANKLPKDSAEVEKKRIRGEVMLLTPEEAEQFVPGEREPTTISGLNKAIIDVKKLMAEAKAKGDIEAAALHKAKGLQLFEQLKNLMAQAEAAMGDF